MIKRKPASKDERARSTAAASKLRRERVTLLLCVDCGAAPVVGKRKCVDCAARSTERGRVARSKRIACARCAYCVAPSEVGIVCRRHWFDKMGRYATGEKGGGPMLERLWLAQGGRCAYTGLQLTPGQDASVDHKTPLARGGARTEENLQWVSVAVNRIKVNLTHDEFVGLCKVVNDEFEPSEAHTRAALTFLASPLLATTGFVRRAQIRKAGQ